MSGTKDSKRLIIVILAVALVSQMNTITSIIMADLSKDFPGASATAIQYVLLFGMIGSFPVSLSVGFLTSRFRIKPMVVTGLAAILAGGLIPIAYHASLTVLYVCAFIVGFGQGFMAPLLGTLILRSFEGKTTIRMIGLNGAFTTGGATVVAMLAGIICVYGWIQTCYLYLLVLPVMILTIIIMPSGETATPATNGAKPGFAIPVKGWIQCVLVLFMYIAYATFPLNISMYVDYCRMGNAMTAGISISVITIVSAAIGLVFQPLVKFVRLYIGAFSALFGFIGMTLACLAGNLTMIYVSSVMLGVFFGTAITGSSYVFSKVCKPEQIGPSFSIVMSFFILGFILSPVIISRITEMWGGVGAKGDFITSAVFFGIILIFQLILNTYFSAYNPNKNCPIRT